MEVPSKDFADTLTCIEYRKSGLSKTLKRKIKETEEYLGRTCRKIWAGRSRTGNVYLYSNFCVNYDKVIITLAYYAPGVGWISCL
jgi:hypothetical protein